MIDNPLFIDKDAIIYNTFGDSFYISGDFTASDEISILHNENLNKYNGIFIAKLISLNKYKYAFGRKAYLDKFKNETIYLPIQYNKDGTPKIDEIKTYSKEGYIPDWIFMENYIKSLPYSDKIA